MPDRGPRSSVVVPAVLLVLLIALPWGSFAPTPLRVSPFTTLRAAPGGPAAISSAMSGGSVRSAGVGVTSGLPRPASPIATGLQNGSDWHDLSNVLPVVPSARALASMTYDPSDGYTMLWGGYASTYGNWDTWAFDNGSWGRLPTAGHPPGATGATLTWDAHDGYAVLYGGENSSGPLAQQWKYGHSTWTQLVTTTNPGPLANAAAAYDPLLGEVVLFGGVLGNFSLSATTWTFTGNEWGKPSLSTAPSARAYDAMVYDPSDGYVLLFGGGDTSGAGSNDTWEFDGSWHQLHPSISPSVRLSEQMAWDPQTGTVILQGGETGSTFLGDTWSFVGGQWTELSPAHSPGTLAAAAVATDQAAGTLVVYSGWPSYTSGPTTKTWVFSTNFTETSPPTTTTEVGAPTPLHSVVFGGVPPYNLTWSVSGAPIAFGANVSPTFSEAGPFDVAFQAIDHSGSRLSATYLVEVSPRLEATAAANRTELDLGQELGFSASTSGGIPPVSLTWQLGQTVQSTSPNFTWTPSAVGNLSENLTATDSIGISSLLTVGVAVAAAPVPSLRGGPPTPSAGVAITLEAGVTGGWPSYGFSWSFGDGSTGTGPNATHTYSAAGPYQLEIQVNDSAGGRGSYTTTIQVAAGPSSSGSTSVLGITSTELLLIVSGLAVVAVVATILVLVRRRRA